ncbi:hypothetical protein Yalta_010 [Yalta virus]|nr:hypothetical protein Yalta_010 [Yalta virus]
MNFFTLILLLFIWHSPCLVQGVFNWDVCQHGSNSTLLSNLYSPDEIKFYCSLNAQELNVHRNLRPSQRRFMPENLPLNPYSSVVDDIEDKESLHRYRRSVQEKSNSIFDRQTLEDGSRSCSDVFYKSEECGVNARRYLYNKIRKDDKDLQNKDNIATLLKELDFIDFSLYHNRGTENETIEFLNILNLIKWDVEISEQFIFQNIIWRCSNIFNNFVRVIRNETNIFHILVSHEKIFSNILHWKILDVDFLFRNFFSTLEGVYMYSNNNNITERMNNFIFEISNIVKNNGFWETQYERFRLYTYINYVKRLSWEDKRKFKTSYVFVRQETILNNTVEFSIGQIKITIHYQEGVLIDQAQEELINVYQKFLSVFNPSHTLFDGTGSTITIRLFRNKEEYNIYGPFFDFSTNNGGITYGNNYHSDIYCYCVGETILNFGHEFVHSLVNTFFFHTHTLYPFIHEGLAEAIGQKEYYLQNGLIENMFKNQLNITYEEMTKLTYSSNVSVYALGFIVFKTIITNNQTYELTESLNHFDNQTHLNNLITGNLNNYKTFANTYITKYYDNINKNNKTNILDISFEQVQKAYFDNYYMDNLTIEIDNTFFSLTRNNIYLSYVWPKCCYNREILNNPQKIQDIIYLFSFMVSSSVKQIPLFETVFPELLKKKENNTIYHYQKVVTDIKMKEKIFNSFFRMANSIGVNYLSSHSKTFTEVKELINIKHRIKHTSYYKLSVPSWNTTSDMQNAIYNINADPKVDLRLIRSVDQDKKIDVDNRDVKEIFSDFFPVIYLEDPRIANIFRKTGLDYLNKNLPLTQQFIPYYNRVGENDLSTSNTYKNSVTNSVTNTYQNSILYKPLTTTNIPVIYRQPYVSPFKPIYYPVNRSLTVKDTLSSETKNDNKVIDNKVIDIDNIAFENSNFIKYFNSFKHTIENRIDNGGMKTQSMLLDVLKSVNNTQNKISRILYQQNKFQTHLDYLSSTFTNFANYITSMKSNDNKDKDYDYSFSDYEYIDPKEKFK